MEGAEAVSQDPALSTEHVDSGSAPWEAEGAGDVPMEGEVRALMLERIASGMPEPERAGFVAYVEKSLVDADGKPAPGAAISFAEAGEALGDYMAARLAELHSEVKKLSDDLVVEKSAAENFGEQVKHLSTQVESLKKTVVAYAARDGTSATASLSGGGHSVTPSLVSPSLAPLLAPLMSLPEPSREARASHPGAGLEAMDIDELRDEVEELGDPIGESRHHFAALADVERAERERRIRDERAIGEARQRLQARHDYANTHTLERIRLAKLRIAKLEAEAAKVEKKQPEMMTA